MADTTISEAQYNVIADFMNTLTDSVDWQSAPDDLKTKYTDAQQALGAIGDALSGGSNNPTDQGTAAPA